MRNQPRRSVPWSELASALLDRGMSISEAARYYGVSPQAISQRLQAHPYAYQTYWDQQRRAARRRRREGDDYQALSMMLLNPRTPGQIRQDLDAKRLELDDARYFNKPEEEVATLEAEVRALETELTEAESGYEKGIRGSLGATRDEFAWEDWRRRRNPVSDAGRYLFVHSCPASTYEDMQALKETARKITRRTFRQKIGKRQWNELMARLGYGRHFPISRDPLPGCYSGVYRGVPAVWLLWSGFEYIYTLDGKLGPSLSPSLLLENPNGLLEEDPGYQASDWARAMRAMPPAMRARISRLPPREQELRQRSWYHYWVEQRHRREQLELFEEGP